MENMKNAVEHPSVPTQGTLDKSMGCSEFKGQAMPIAYGQAGPEGCKSDEGKISSQFKDYHWAE